MPNDLYLIEHTRNLSWHTKEISRSGLAHMPPLILTCTLSGHASSCEETFLSDGLESIVQQGYHAYQNGASILTLDSDIPVSWAQALFPRLRQLCPDVILGNSMGGRRWITRDDNLAYTTSLPDTDQINAAPELSVVDISCGVYGEDERVGFMAHMDLERLICLVRAHSVKPCFRLGKTTDIKYLNYLERKGLLDAPYWCEMRFGEGAVPPLLEEMITAEQDLPEHGLFCATCDDAAQPSVLLQAMVLGLHIRVSAAGPCYDTHLKPAADSSEKVLSIALLAKELGRPVATPAQARMMLELPSCKDDSCDQAAAPHAAAERRADR